MNKIRECPCCGGVGEIERDANIFAGQHYYDRYPEPVASQNHGLKIRCVRCGLQTCWWHYESEAIGVWNNRYSHEEAV